MAVISIVGVIVILCGLLFVYVKEGRNKRQTEDEIKISKVSHFQSSDGRFSFEYPELIGWTAVVKENQIFYSLDKTNTTSNQKINYNPIIVSWEDLRMKITKEGWESYVKNAEVNSNGVKYYSDIRLHPTKKEQPSGLVFIVGGDLIEVRITGWFGEKNTLHDMIRDSFVDNSRQSVGLDRPLE